MDDLKEKKQVFGIIEHSVSTFSLVTQHKRINKGAKFFFLDRIFCQQEDKAEEEQ